MYSNYALFQHSNSYETEGHPFKLSQGWLVSSTIDYLSSDSGSLSFTWVLATIGWLGPTLVMVYSHVIINNHHRSFYLLSSPVPNPKPPRPSPNPVKSSQNQFQRDWG